MNIYYSLNTKMTEVHVKVTRWVSVCVEPLCWVEHQVLAVLNS